MCPILCLHPLFFPHHLKGNYSQRSTLFIRAYPTWLVSCNKSWHCMFRQLALRKPISWASDHTLQMLQGHGNEWQLRKSYWLLAVVGASHPAPAASSPQPSHCWISRLLGPNRPGDLVPAKQDQWSVKERGRSQTHPRRHHCYATSTIYQGWCNPKLFTAISVEGGKPKNANQLPSQINNI